jgi:hypothetical protein
MIITSPVAGIEFNVSKLLPSADLSTTNVLLFISLVVFQFKDTVWLDNALAVNDRNVTGKEPLVFVYQIGEVMVLFPLISISA